jgi:tryptophan halogenase
MPIHAERFNTLFRYRWDRIVDFLKLHYVLSERDEPYWRDHRDPASIPPRLADLLRLWRDQPPSRADLPAADEIFPAASYQYILYGMGFPAPPVGTILGAPGNGADATTRPGRAARPRRSLPACPPTAPISMR